MTRADVVAERARTRKPAPLVSEPAPTANHKQPRPEELAHAVKVATGIVLRAGTPSTASVIAGVSARHPEAPAALVAQAVADHVGGLELDAQAAFALADGLHRGKLGALARKIASHLLHVASSGERTRLEQARAPLVAASQR